PTVPWLTQAIASPKQPPPNPPPTLPYNRLSANARRPPPPTMPTRTERFLEMPPAAPGTLRLLKAITYGRPDARPVAYLQAGLHADELPGMMVLHKLGKLLDAIDANDGITGHIVIVPVANPIGL